MHGAQGFQHRGGVGQGLARAGNGRAGKGHAAGLVGQHALKPPQHVLHAEGAAWGFRLAEAAAGVGACGHGQVNAAGLEREEAVVVAAQDIEVLKR